LEAGKGCFRFLHSARLTHQKDFQRVFDHAKKSGDPCFTVLFTGNQQDHPRLGLAITKKVAKRAVDRNRIKRIVRESFRLNQHRLGMLDIVVLARAGTKERASQILFASLEKHWDRLEKQCQVK
jgi:ribonuclease P protein component